MLEDGDFLGRAEPSFSRVSVLGEVWAELPSFLPLSGQKPVPLASPLNDRLFPSFSVSQVSSWARAESQPERGFWKPRPEATENKRGTKQAPQRPIFIPPAEQQPFLKPSLREEFLGQTPFSTD